jgi:hypothetical protein
MTDESSDAQLFTAMIEDRLARMSDTDWHALTMRVRPPTEQSPEVALKRQLAAKAGQLQAVPRDENGSLGAWQAAVDATGGPAELPQPAQPEQTGPHPFAPNRGQGGAGGDWTPPVAERDLNNQLIADILDGKIR